MQLGIAHILVEETNGKYQCECLDLDGKIIFEWLIE
jgi:hypothetical protein